MFIKAYINLYCFINMLCNADLFISCCCVLQIKQVKHGEGLPWSEGRELNPTVYKICADCLSLCTV